MESFDRPSTPEPSTVSNRPIAIRYGLIIAAAGVLMSLVAFLTDTDPAMPDAGSSKWLYILGGFAVSIWAISTAIKADREQLGGFISLGRCVGLGAFIGLVSGVVSMLYMLVYTHVINPDFSSDMLAAMHAQWEEQGLSEEQIEMASGMTGMFTNPIFLSFSQVFNGVIMAVIIALFAGLVLKREPAK
jgi:hypothetical protein